MSDNYISDKDGNVTKVDDIIEWAKQFDNDQKKVTFTEFEGSHIQVSTVFLGLDHSWDRGPPILWETMVFGLPISVDEIQIRYISLENSWIGHENIVKRIIKDYTIKPETRHDTHGGYNGPNHNVQ